LPNSSKIPPNSTKAVERIFFVFFYNRDMEVISRTLAERFSSKEGRILYHIAKGADMTKLDVKNAAECSMSTVLSAVTALEKAGLVTVRSDKAKSGGKPHSAINAAQGNAVYGISYKAGVLTGSALGLRGERLCNHSVRVSDGKVSPHTYVERVVDGLLELSPPPLAIALAMNCNEVEKVGASLSERLSVPHFLLTNTAAMAYRRLWETERYPFAVIGVGNRVKCAVLSDACRVFDAGSLLCPVAATAESGRYESLLSVSEVERCLRERAYRGHFFLGAPHPAEITSAGEYSRLLALTLATLADTAERMLAPCELCLFGEYVTDGFFDRIRAESRRPDSLRLLRSSPADFADGAALCALVEGVFSR